MWDGKYNLKEYKSNKENKKMSDKNIEMMKKLIEEKKKKGLEKGSNLRPQKNIGGGTSKVKTSKKTGGLFD
jgi:hypothetical protein